ncbi:MAG: DUF354 domain-containing protein [Sulfolobales archaeon]
MRKIIWFDALTSKQLLIGASLKKYLAERGYETILTAREYDVIRGLVEKLGIEAVIFGRYADDLYEKIVAESERMIHAVEILSRHREELIAGVSYPNPVEARVVYGIGKPYIVLSDSPHAKHPHRLTLPLAKYLVYSKCIPENAWREYTLPTLTLVAYDGFDELSWIKDLPEVSSRKYIEELDLDEYSYVVLRPEEYKASYYEWGFNRDFWVELSKRIIGKRLRVVILPRYSDQKIVLSNDLREYIEKKMVVIPDPASAIGPALVKYSLAVVTGGGTMAREAALQGVLGITTFPTMLHVDKCVEELKLPLHYIRDINKICELIDEYIRDIDRSKEKIKTIVSMKKSPNEVIYGLLKELEAR